MWLLCHLMCLNSVTIVLTPFNLLVTLNSQVKSKTGYLNPSFPTKFNGWRSSLVTYTPSRSRLRNGGMLVHGVNDKMQGRIKQKKTILSWRNTIAACLMTALHFLIQAVVYCYENWYVCWLDIICIIYGVSTQFN